MVEAAARRGVRGVSVPLFALACVQVNAGDDMAANIAAAEALVRDARGAGADVVALPENVAMMAASGQSIRAAARPEGSHPALAAFRRLAIETGVWLLIGSLGVRLRGARIANRSYWIAPDGGIRARYDKIHMFDVDLPSGERFRESESFRPGAAAVSAASPWGPFGLTICYDLRFAHLYRSLARAGAGYLAVPSAFTRVTGRAHWHVLLRARAIETGAYVFAPAQAGDHPGGRQTFGHALIVDPWGAVLADAGEAPGFVVTTIDPTRIEEARAMIPALDHDRDFAPPDGTDAAPARAAE